MAAAKQITVKFTQERETKNTVRYAEDGDPDTHAVGTLYVQKSHLEKIGTPETLTVTIK